MNVFKILNVCSSHHEFTVIKISGDTDAGELLCSCYRDPQVSTIQDFNSETEDHHLDRSEINISIPSQASLYFYPDTRML